MNADLGSNYTIRNWIDAVRNSPNDLKGTIKRILIAIVCLTIFDFVFNYLQTLNSSRVLVSNIELPADSNSVNSEYTISIIDSKTSDLKILQISNTFPAKEQFGKSLSFGIFVGFLIGLLNKKSNQQVDPTVKTPVESGNEQGTAGHP